MGVESTGLASTGRSGGHGAHQLEDECPVAVELEERDERHEHAANTLDDVRVNLGSGHDELAEWRSDEGGGDHEQQQRQAAVLRDLRVPQQERLRGEQGERLYEDGVLEALTVGTGRVLDNGGELEDEEVDDGHAEAGHGHAHVAEEGGQREHHHVHDSHHACRDCTRGGFRRAKGAPQRDSATGVCNTSEGKFCRENGGLLELMTGSKT
eukprot:scaffold59620_cov50-Phaeocystis_antarctica.AAC.2